MTMVLLTALGVGGATILGAVLGLVFKNITHKFSDIVLSFAAGIMMAAAVLGLVLPSLEYGGRYGLVTTVAGIFAGAVAINLMDRFVPHLHRLAGVDIENHPDSGQVSRVLLFVLAIAIHNLPEGVAAGVGFGSGNVHDALLISGGIALQNIPEGMVIIGPMLASGISRGRTFALALATGLVEIEKAADAWAYDYAKNKVAFLKDHPDLPHYFVGAGNQWGATYSYAMCYWEEQMWIRTKSITCPEFFHGMQEILVADTPVTLFMGEDEQRPLAERVARFLPKVCANYTIIDTKELAMEGISPEFRGSLSHLMMHAVNNRVDAYMELFLRHPLSIRRYYRQFDY